MRSFFLLAFALTIGFSGCNSPKPGPVDPDNPGSHLNIVVIEETLGRTPENSVAIRDAEFWHQQRAKGHKVLFLRTGTDQAKPFQSALEKIGGLPAILLQNPQSGKYLIGKKLPNDIASVQELIGKYEAKRGPPVYHDSTGKVRKLGLIPATPERKERQRKQFKSFGSLLESSGLKLIPQEKWVDIETPHWNRPEYVIDQGQTSSCVGASGAAAAGKTLESGGKPFELQSGPFLYAFINNGQDSGAYIGDCLETLTKNGTVPAKLFGYKDGLFLRQIPASVREEGLRHRLTVGYILNTEAELATAVQMGFVCQAGVQVDSSFERFDSSGVSSARGRYANHSIHIDGMKKIGSGWVYHMPNTWGAKWGAFNNGSCYLRPEGVIIEGDAFVHADYDWTPEQLPIVKRIELTERLNHADDHRFALAQ